MRVFSRCSDGTANEAFEFELSEEGVDDTDDDADDKNGVPAIVITDGDTNKDNHEEQKSSAAGDKTGIDGWFYLNLTLNIWTL